MYSAQAFQEGQLLLMDKPLSWSSFDVVNKMRYLIKRHCNIKKIKVGHAGTLDPLATGLMLICTGKYTKRIAEFMGQEKRYMGTIMLGGTTPSYDLETAIDATFPYDHISTEEVYAFAKAYTGTIQQRPPIFSALRKEGKRLYEYARKGQTVDIPTREVTVSQFDITRIALPEVDFDVTCSKGTYIRSLAYDLGKGLDSGAHLTALRRTHIGDYAVADAMSIEDFEKRFE